MAQGLGVGVSIVVPEGRSFGYWIKPTVAAGTQHGASWAVQLVSQADPAFRGLIRPHDSILPDDASTDWFHRFCSPCERENDYKFILSSKNCHLLAHPIVSSLLQSTPKQSVLRFPLKHEIVFRPSDLQFSKAWRTFHHLDRKSALLRLSSLLFSFSKTPPPGCVTGRETGPFGATIGPYQTFHFRSRAA